MLALIAAVRLLSPGALGVEWQAGRLDGWMAGWVGAGCKPKKGKGDSPTDSRVAICKRGNDAHIKITKINYKMEPFKSNYVYNYFGNTDSRLNVLYKGG
jgi:hypothetical protein